jgi:hypothetical protein
MSNPTTPFGWQMPTSTDLVTDLPADFEVFGQAVATSMADLLGGTTGQVLSKTTNADMDFTWTSANPGDITAVTAGTGISGGGTSGDVTITNSMATAIDAKGDLIVGTGADTFSKLTAGTNGYLLTADSAEATGLKWTAPPSSGGMTLLSTTTMSGAVTTISSISGSYKQLYVIWYGMTNSTGNGYMEMKFNNTGNYSGLKSIASSGSATAQAENNVSIVRLSYGVNVSTNANNFAAMTINDYASTSNRKTFTVSFNYATSEVIDYTGAFLNNSAISELNFSNTGGDWSAGTVKVYGVN